MGIECVKAIAEIVGIALGAASAAVSVFTYRSNSRRERAKWIVQLFEKFYEHQELYTTVREALDCEPDTPEVQKLVAEQKAQFTDYLNFFELMAFLVKSGQLSKDDVEGLFHYYLHCLKKRSTVMLYIRDPENGFEKLTAFLGKMESLRHG